MVTVRFPGATTPYAEVPALNRIASHGAIRDYRFASDEDVEWQSGHGVDPRVHQFLLTDDAIGWCDEELGIVHGLLQRLDSRFPRPERSWDEARYAFTSMMIPYGRARPTPHITWAASIFREPASAIRTEPYPSRQFPEPKNSARSSCSIDICFRTTRGIFHRRCCAGSFTASTNSSAISDTRSFRASTFRSPRLRHAGRKLALSYMFAPVVLQRIADLPSKGVSTITMADLFTWNQNAIFGDLRTAQSQAPRAFAAICSAVTRRCSRSWRRSRRKGRHTTRKRWRVTSWVIGSTNRRRAAQDVRRSDARAPRGDACRRDARLARP